MGISKTIRQFVKSVKKTRVPEDNSARNSTGRLWSICVIPKTPPANSKSNFHSVPVMLSDVGPVTTTEPINERLPSLFEKLPLTFDGVCRQAFINLPNASKAEVMFISLVQDHGLDEAIKMADELDLEYSRPLYALRVAMNKGSRTERLLPQAAPQADSQSVFQTSEQAR